MWLSQRVRNLRVFCYCLLPLCSVLLPKCEIDTFDRVVSTTLFRPHCGYVTTTTGLLVPISRLQIFPCFFGLHRPDHRRLKHRVWIHWKCIVKSSKKIQILKSEYIQMELSLVESWQRGGLREGSSSENGRNSLSRSMLVLLSVQNSNKLETRWNKVAGKIFVFHIVKFTTKAWKIQT